MSTLKQVWAWDGVDYLIQLALICVFAYGFMYASGANQTLTDSGCKAYWQEYNPQVDLSENMLVNKTQGDRLRRGGPAKLTTKKPENTNYSEIINSGD